MPKLNEKKWAKWNIVLAVLRLWDQTARKCFCCTEMNQLDRDTCTHSEHETVYVQFFPRVRMQQQQQQQTAWGKTQQTLENL